MAINLADRLERGLGMPQPRQHDLFTNEMARSLLDLPAQWRRVLGLPDDVALPPIFTEHTQARLRSIVALDDMRRRKIRATFGCARREIDEAVEMLKRMVELSGMFEQLACTRSQMETIPDGYRQAMTVQRRRRQLKIIGME